MKKISFMVYPVASIDGSIYAPDETTNEEGYVSEHFTEATLSEPKLDFRDAYVEIYEILGNATNPEEEEEPPVSSKRALDLLNAMIEDLSVGENTKEVIARLSRIGFTDDELVNVFNFDYEDIMEVENDE